MLADERRMVVEQLPRLADLTPGRTGNLSVARGDYIVITPSGVPYREIDVDDIPVVTTAGEQPHGEYLPSSELPLHQAIYDRFEPGAIAHVHSPWATTLAVLNEPLPPVHYMVALAGNQVPVAEYATYGSEDLGDNVVDAMAQSDAEACLLSNHGLVTTADSPESAIETAEAVESVAQLYCQAGAIGTPRQLSDDEIERVSRKLNDDGPEND